MSGPDVDGQLPLSKLFVATLSTANDPKRVEHLLLDTFSQSKNWSWGLSGRSWTLWASLGVVLGGSWGDLGSSWGPLGTLLGSPGRSWEAPGAVLGAPKSTKNRSENRPRNRMGSGRAKIRYACSGFRRVGPLPGLTTRHPPNYQTG